MNTRYLRAFYRFGFGILVIAAMAVQFHKTAHASPMATINFFSFFTIESNILASIVFLIAGWGALSSKRTGTFASLRGAATLYMTVTGIVYILLLSGLEASLQATVPWVNFVLHYLMPIVVLADWLADVPPFRLRFSRAAWWLAFPAVYLVYSLVRGAHVDWYPYPFLDPRTHGYGRVAIGCIGIAVVGMGLTWLLAGYTRLRAKA